MTRTPTPLASYSVVLRQGDDLPGFAAQIVDHRGEPVDLTDAMVMLHIVGERSVQVDGEWVEDMLLDDECWIANAAQGVITYDWSSAQTAEWEPGVYVMHVGVRYEDGRVTGAPSDRSVDFVVRPRVFHESTILNPPLPRRAAVNRLGRGVHRRARRR